jgi:hypothetical protein
MRVIEEPMRKLLKAVNFLGLTNDGLSCDHQLECQSGIRDPHSTPAAPVTLSP